MGFCQYNTVPSVSDAALRGEGVGVGGSCQKNIVPSISHDAPDNDEFLGVGVGDLPVEHSSLYTSRCTRSGHITRSGVGIHVVGSRVFWSSICLC